MNRMKTLLAQMQQLEQRIPSAEEMTKSMIFSEYIQDGGRDGT